MKRIRPDRPHPAQRTTVRDSTAIAAFVAAVLCIVAASPQAEPAAVRSADTASQVEDTVRGTTRIVEILRADSSAAAVVGGERVRRLIGNVHLRQERTDLWARTATQYLDRDEILFEGAVRIVEDTDTLDADRILYNSAAKVGRATGNVRLSDGEAVALAPSGRYFVREKRAEFDETVELQDSVSVLTSRAGQYWTEEKRAEFYDTVRLVHEGSTMYSDSLTHFRETEFSIARGNVYMVQIGDGDSDAVADSTRINHLFGDYAEYDNRTEYSRVDGNALLMRIEIDATDIDTLFIRADGFTSTLADSVRRLIALGNVETWRDTFAARADSTVYDRIETEVHPGSEDDEHASETQVVEDIRLYHNPIAWIKESQLTGDSMRIARHQEVPDTLFVRQNAFVAGLDTLLNRINELKGVSLFGLFEDDEISFMQVYPNAEAIYYIKNDDDELDGAVQISADTVSFWFNAGEVSRVRGSRGIEGLYYEAEDIPDPFHLVGFHWRPDDRPTREQFLSDERLAKRNLVPPRLITVRRLEDE